MNTDVLKPDLLDRQSPVKVNRWIDIDSDECKELDQDRKFTKKILLMGFQDNGPDDPAWMYVDGLGRVWGKDPRNPSSQHYPLHFETARGELIGYRIVKKAAN